jgi:hypothetical protein
MATKAKLTRKAAQAWPETRRPCRRLDVDAGPDGRIGAGALEDDEMSGGVGIRTFDAGGRVWQQI